MPKNPFTKALNHARKRRVAPTVTRQLDPDGLILDGATALLEAAETGLHASTGTVTDPSMTSGMLTHVFRLLSLESLLSAGTGQGTRNGMLGMGIVTDLQVPADTAGHDTPEENLQTTRFERSINDRGREFHGNARPAPKTGRR